MSSSGNAAGLVERSLAAMRELRQKYQKLEAMRTGAIAVIGIGCRLPGGASDPEALWRLLRDKVSAVREVPASRWQLGGGGDPAVSPLRYAALLDDPELFDTYFFGISPREAAQMDPQQRLFLEVAWHALEDAGLPIERVAGTDTGVFVGANAGDYLQLQLSEAEEIDTYTLTGGVHCIIANRLSYLFDLQGPSMAVDTACSSSLVTVHLACQSLRLGECSTAIVGGINTILSPTLAAAHAQGLPLAPDGRCKTFDARADGYVRAEGCGVLVLKRLADALADGDRVRAVISGSAVNQDGRSNGLTAPSGRAQRRVIQAALASAGLAASKVELIEAHGTGTSLGDPIEVEALREVYGAAAAAEARPCTLGSIKTNLGHLEAGAGVAGVIKAVLAVEKGAIPANLHFETVNPMLATEGSRFHFPVEMEAWPRPRPERHAAVSAFGAGGTNAHVIVSGGPAMEPSPAAGDAAAASVPHLLLISGRSREALAAVALRYAGWLEDGAGRELPLADVCASARLRRTHHTHRLGVVGATRAELIEKLRAAAAGLTDQAAPVVESAGTPRVALLFSGDVADTVTAAAAAELAALPVYAAARARVVAALHAGGRGAGGTRNGAGEPATPGARLFAHQVALAEVLRGWGLAPGVVSGWGVGEIAAAHVAGALSLEDAALVVSRRDALLAQGARGAQVGLALGAAIAGIAPRPPALPLHSAALDRELDARSGVELDGDYWAASLRAPERFPAGLAGELLRLQLGAATTGAALLEHAAALYAASAALLRLDALDASLGGGRWAPLPLYPFQREPFWFRRVARSAAGRIARGSTAGSAAAAATPGRTGARTAEELRVFLHGEVCRLLGFAAERLDPNGGFFQMGMDSVMAAQLRNRLEQELGRKLPVTMIFENPTVMSLAAALAAEEGGAAPPPAPELAPVVELRARRPVVEAAPGEEEALLELLRRELDGGHGSISGAIEGS